MDRESRPVTGLRTRSLLSLRSVLGLTQQRLSAVLGQDIH